MPKNQHIFARLLPILLAAFFVSSCGGEDSKQTTDAVVTTAAEKVVDAKVQDPVVQTRVDDSSFSDTPFSIPMYLNDVNSTVLQGPTMGTGAEKNSDLIRRLSVDFVSGESKLDVVDAFYVQNGKNHSIVHVVQNNTDETLCGGHFEEPRLADKTGSPVTGASFGEFYGTPITIELPDSKKITVNGRCIGPGDALYSATADYFPAFKFKENKEKVLPEHIPEKVAGFTGELRVFDTPDNAQFDQASVKPLSYTISSTNRVRVLIENQHPTQEYVVDARFYPLDVNGFPLAAFVDDATAKMAPGQQKQLSFKNDKFSGTAHALRVVTKLTVLYE